MIAKDTILQIIADQKEDIKNVLKGGIIQREIHKKAESILASDFIKVIIGVRRCGKSTFVHHALRDKEYGYVNFDDERLITVKAEDLNIFLEAIYEYNSACKYLFFDEIQNIQGWELFVNRLKRTGHNVIVTGSNSGLLGEDLAVHLTGRHFTINLHPFSFREYCDYRKYEITVKKQYSTKEKIQYRKYTEEYLHTGGMPEAIKSELSAQYLRELYDKIITKDIIYRYNVKYIKDLKEIALFALTNFASKISYHKIKNIFEMKSVHTVKNYISYLEDAYLLFQLNAFSNKLKENFKLPKKIYCIDNGIIESIAPKVVDNNARLLENAVFLELKRRGNEIYFYSGPDYETDFVIKDGVKVVHLIQSCYSIKNKSTEEREIKALLKTAQKTNCKDLTIITWEEEGELRENSFIIKYIPFWKWLLKV